MSQEIAAKRYARALFEIGLTDKKIEELGKELAKYKDLYLSGALEFLSNPVFTTDEKKQAMRMLFEKEKASRDFKNFFDLLIEEKRCDAIDEIDTRFRMYVNEHENQELADVYSVVKLSSKQVKSLKETLSKIRGKKIIVDNRIDESVMGGLKIKIGSFLYDGSVRGLIDKFKEQN